MSDLAYDEVSKLLAYEPETGKLYWLERGPEMFRGEQRAAESACNRWNGRLAGREAFTTRDGTGYLVGSIFDRKYSAHRIIWLLHSGAWPDGEIDHINGDRCDNRIINLRDVARGENLKNRKVPTNNTSGGMGVYWRKDSRRWQAQINIGGRNRHIGFFANLDEAVAARKAAEAENGYHSNHGRAA